MIGSCPKRLLCDLPLFECLDDDILLTESADLLPKCSISTSFRAWRTQQKIYSPINLCCLPLNWLHDLKISVCGLISNEQVSMERASPTDSAEYYHSCRSCNKMGSWCCGLPADNRVPEGGLADGGWGAFLSRSRRQEAEAGELVSQSHPETHSKHVDIFTFLHCGVAVSVMSMPMPTSTCICCGWWHKWTGCRWSRPLLWLRGRPSSKATGC